MRTTAWALVAALLLGSCSTSTGGTGSNGSAKGLERRDYTPTTGPPRTSAPPVADAEQVFAAWRLNLMCDMEPSSDLCPYVTGMTADDSAVIVTTTLFADSDAVEPSKRICGSVTAGSGPVPIRVYGQGDVLLWRCGDGDSRPGSAITVPED